MIKFHALFPPEYNQAGMKGIVRVKMKRKDII
jgi:hypothetical protein